MFKEHSCKIAVLRFLAVILVVFWHANNLTLHYGGAVFEAGQWGTKAVETFISVGLVRISTPLLFAISGFLFFRNFDGCGFARWFGTKLKTRVQTLLVPYLFWSAWGLLVVFLMQQVPPARPFFYTTLVADYTPAEWFDKLFLNPFPYQLWFLRDLMVYVLLTPVIYPCLRWGGMLLPGVFVGLWLWDIPLTFVVTEGLCFYLIGAWLAQDRRNRFSRRNSRIEPLNPCQSGPMTLSRRGNRSSLSPGERAGVRAGVIHTHFAPGLMGSGFELKLPALLIGLWVLICAVVAIQVVPEGQITDWLQKLGVACGCAGVWLGYDACLKRHELWLDAWAQYAIFLFAAHEPLLTVLKKTTIRCLGSSEAALLAAYFIAPTVTIGIVLVAAVLVRRHLPRFYFLVSGHR